jgi:two-component system invasion response regulator UvrY
VRAVLNGQYFIASEVAKKLTLSHTRHHGADSPLRRLTAREMQVMMLVVRGQSNQAIAETLSLSPKTVYTYRSRILEKLGMANDVELTHFCIRHGLVEGPV